MPFTTLVVTDVSPAVVKSDGGYLLTFTGEFKEEPIAVDILYPGNSVRCYSGKSGQGDVAFPDSETVLTVSTPVLPVSGPFDIQVTQGLEVVTLYRALTSVAPDFHERVFKMRRIFPRWYATGVRDLLTESLVLEEDLGIADYDEPFEYGWDDVVSPLPDPDFDSVSYDEPFDTGWDGT